MKFLTTTKQKRKARRASAGQPRHRRSMVAPPRHVLAPFGIGLIVAALVPAAASASTQIGSKLEASVNGQVQCGGPCTQAQVTSDAGSTASGGLRAPAAGVITSWRIKTGDDSPPVKLRVLRAEANSVGKLGGIATGRLVTPTPGTISEFPKRLPIAAGDQIGIDSDKPITAYNLGDLQKSNNLETWGNAGASPLADGDAPRTPNSAVGPHAQLLVQATIERDADGDGYGDETQDLCLGIPGPEDGCPTGTRAQREAEAHAAEAAAAGVPDARIAKLRVDRTHHRARARLSSAGGFGAVAFECRIDKGPFRPCASPATFRRLGTGRHTLRVRAIDSEGQVDPTPAKRVFRIPSHPKR